MLLDKIEFNPNYRSNISGLMGIIIGSIITLKVSQVVHFYMERRADREGLNTSCCNTMYKRFFTAWRFA